MKAAGAKLAPYAKDVTAYLQCLSAEMKSSKDEYDGVAADWKKQTDIFKAQPAK